MKIKKILKNNIVGFILGAILFSGIGVVIATTSANSEDVWFETTRSANTETLEDALDYLYSQVPTKPITCYNGVCGSLSYRYWNNNFAGSSGANVFDSTHMPANNYATRALLEQNYNDFSDEPIYIRSVLIDGNVVGHESCFWEANNEKEFCFGPNYWAGTIGTADATVGTNTKIKLQRDMQNALSLESTDISCGSGADSAGCDVGDFGCDANSYGSVACYSFVSSVYCRVDAGGSAYCEL